MSASENQRLVEKLWGYFDAFDFAAVAPLLHDDFVCEWPQSRERMRGRDNYIAVNEHYPGRWRIAIERIVAAGDGVATQVRLEWDGRVEYAVSFFEFRDGRIVKQVDWWPEPYPAPEWRAQWVERMDGTA
jgi:ketosteroid isomerase-like protein